MESATVTVSAAMFRTAMLLKSAFRTVARFLASNVAPATLNVCEPPSIRMPSPEFTERYCARIAVRVRLTEPDLVLNASELTPR